VDSLELLAAKFYPCAADDELVSDEQLQADEQLQSLPLLLVDHEYQNEGHSAYFHKLSVANGD
jgi:hypothetical protein